MIRPTLSSYLAPGALGGFVPGVFVGGLVGAGISWGAGAALQWMRQLSFTTGIQIQLMPFGDRTAVLETLGDGWYWVIVAAALTLGLLGALLGSFTALILWSLRRTLEVEVEAKSEPESEVPPAESDRRRISSR